MASKRERFLPVYLLAVLLPSSCANPVPPSGGPQDRTPPAVVASEPAGGDVNARPDALRLEFSEFVNRSSFESAVRVVPAFEAPLTFSWGRRAVEILFPAPLRVNTTYRVTIETGFQDVHGVALRRPFTLAFATGPRIHQGRIAGRVTEADTRRPADGIFVYAYADAPADSLPADSIPADTLPAANLPPSPDYRTLTGPDGTFLFTYLREQPYYVAALADDNRNRQRDVNEAYAVPPRRAITADTSAAASPPDWWLGRPDKRPAPFTRFGPRNFARDTLIWLTPAETPVIRFRTRPDTSRMESFISVEDTSGTDRTFSGQPIDTASFNLVITPPIAPGDIVTVRVVRQDSAAAQSYARFSTEELGGLTGVVAVADTGSAAAPVIVQLYSGRGDEIRRVRSTVAGPAGGFTFEHLPEQVYRLRAFVDSDGDEEWDVGQLAPYLPGEPISWAADSTRVRARWETALADTITF